MAIVVTVVESRGRCGEYREYGNGRRWRGINLFGERQCRVKYETENFGRQAGNYGFSGREGENGVDYFTGLLKETGKKEFSFREIESEIVRRHPR